MRLFAFYLYQQYTKYYINNNTNEYKIYTQINNEKGMITLTTYLNVLQFLFKILALTICYCVLNFTRFQEQMYELWNVKSSFSNPTETTRMYDTLIIHALTIVLNHCFTRKIKKMF